MAWKRTVDELLEQFPVQRTPLVSALLDIIRQQQQKIDRLEEEIRDLSQ